MALLIVAFGFPETASKDLETTSGELVMPRQPSGVR
jgi:hypothetical protein